MASGGFKCIKPELVAIYRLEFYKNKKKWKLSNDRKEAPAPQSQGPQPPPRGAAAKTTRRDKLNETYEVTPSSDSEKESSPLNNAFMHEIPTDDTPEDEVYPPSLICPPTEDAWAPPGGPPRPVSVNGDVAPGAQSPSGAQAQTLGPFTDQPQAQPTPNKVHNDLDNCVESSQQPGRTTLCTDQRQPDVNLEWLLRTSGRTPANLEHAYSQPATQEPWQCNFWTNEQTPGLENIHSQGQWTEPPPMISNSQQRSQNNIVSSTGHRLFNPNPWSIPPPISHVPPKNKVMSTDLPKNHGVNYLKEEQNLPQPPPANCLQMLLCPDTWKSQNPNNLKYQDQFATTGAAIDAVPVTEPLLLRNQRAMPHQNTIRPDSLANLEQPPCAPPLFDRRLVSETWINNQSVSHPQNWIEKQNIHASATLNNRQNVPSSDTWTLQPHKQSIPATDTKMSNQSVPPPGSWTNKYSVPSTGTLTNRQSTSPPDTWTEKQSIPTAETWINQTQKVSQFPCQESYANQRPSARIPQLVTPEDLLHRVHQEPKIKAPPPTPETCSTEPWCDFQKVQDVWTNPAQYANLEEIQQNFWNQQAWQKEDDYVNQEWAPSAGEDVPDGAGEEAFPPYSAVSVGAGEGGALPPAQVRRVAAAWLARLLALEPGPAPPDHEPCQGGSDESADFIREAHDVPHSSEKDPNETRELCGCVPPAALPGLPARRLAAALHHAARGLHHLLHEQLHRDRLRTQTLQNMAEYPTRDTDLFPRELVVGGSHVTRAPAAGALGADEGPDRLIKIAMGRPYRL